MKNDRVMPINDPASKVVSGLFWPHFLRYRLQITPKWAQNFLEASIKNASPLVSEEFSLLTAAKRIMEKY